MTLATGARRTITMLTCGVLATGAALAAAAPALAGPETERLNPGEQLVSGQRLVSPDGQFVLLMQSDGNLVEYASGNRAVWATGTNVGNSVVTMQSDGNAVVIAPGNRAVWATGTSGNPNSTLELQNDGNIVVYAPGHTAKWGSGPRTGSGALGARIADIARAETANGSRNHETGTNCNFYSGAVGTGSPCGNGWRAEEWCADFARWVWGQAGARTDGLSPAAASFASYGRAKGTWKAGAAVTNARVGDAVVFDLNGSYASHVGLVTAVSGNTITMISGNSADAVRTTTIDPSSSGVSGYASPAS